MPSADPHHHHLGPGDILLYDNSLVLYKQAVDLTFYVIGPAGENELMLSSVLGAFYDAVALLLRHQVEKRAILENLDLVVLALDETIDNGSVPSPFFRRLHGSVPMLTRFMPNGRIVLETDPIAIASRVSRPRPDATVNLADIQLNEQSIMQVCPPLGGFSPQSCAFLTSAGALLP